MRHHKIGNEQNRCSCQQLISEVKAEIIMRLVMLSSFDLVNQDLLKVICELIGVIELDLIQSDQNDKLMSIDDLRRSSPISLFALLAEWVRQLLDLWHQIPIERLPKPDCCTTSSVDSENDQMMICRRSREEKDGSRCVRPMMGSLVKCDGDYHLFEETPTLHPTGHPLVLPPPVVMGLAPKDGSKKIDGSSQGGLNVFASSSSFLLSGDVYAPVSMSILSAAVEKYLRRLLFALLCKFSQVKPEGQIRGPFDYKQDNRNEFQFRPSTDFGRERRSSELLDDKSVIIDTARKKRNELSDQLQIKERSMGKYWMDRQQQQQQRRPIEWKFEFDRSHHHMSYRISSSRYIPPPFVPPRLILMNTHYELR